MLHIIKVHVIVINERITYDNILTLVSTSSCRMEDDAIKGYLLFVQVHAFSLSHTLTHTHTHTHTRARTHARIHTHYAHEIILTMLCW
jgi:hypothetical protein